MLHARRMTDRERAAWPERCPTRWSAQPAGVLSVTERNRCSCSSISRSVRLLNDSCSGLKPAFPSRFQMEHYKLDWHRFNLRQKMAALPPVTAEEFERKTCAGEKNRIQYIQLKVKRK